MDAPAARERPAIEVAVVMAREAAPNRWEDWRFHLVEVLAMQPAFGRAARCLHDDGKVARFLHPGLRIELFRDEAEGYHLNLSSGAPVVFVMWRIDEADPSRAWPEAVSLSYHEAGRWLDAQERVDNCPLPPDWREWLQAYTELHHQPEPRKRRRSQSFLPPGARG